MESVLGRSTLWDEYLVVIDGVSPLEGGQPKNPELIRAWLESKGEPEEIIAKQVAEMGLTAEEAAALVASAKEAGSWCGFKSDGERYYLGCFQVKAMLKECASVLKLTQRKRGLRDLNQHGNHVRPVDPGAGDRLYVTTPDDQWVTGELPTRDSVCHLWRGSALKRNDYIDPWRLAFVVRLLCVDRARGGWDPRQLTEADLKTVLQLAEESGLGANRSQGYGRFRVVEFKEL